MPLKPARFDGKAARPGVCTRSQVSCACPARDRRGDGPRCEKGLGNIFAPFADGTGRVAELAESPSLDRHNAFFEVSLGTKRASMRHCTKANQGVSIQCRQASIKHSSPRTASIRFFRLNDTADPPDADVIDREGPEESVRTVPGFGRRSHRQTFKGNSDPDNLATTQSDFPGRAPNTPDCRTLPNLKDPQHPGIASLALSAVR